MSKKLNIPFYENTENWKQCLQVVMKTALKYFLNKEFSLEKLDELTWRKDEFWTWTHQWVVVLDELGLNVKYFSRTNDLEKYLAGEAYIREKYWNEASELLEKIDLESLVVFLQKLLNKNLFEAKKLTIEEIENFISDWNIVIAALNNNKIYQRGEQYAGHFIVLTWFDDENIYYYESGPWVMKWPDRKVSKEIFLQASVEDDWADGDFIIVYWKK